MYLLNDTFNNVYNEIENLEQKKEVEATMLTIKITMFCMFL